VPARGAVSEPVTGRVRDDGLAEVAPTPVDGGDEPVAGAVAVLELGDGVGVPPDGDGLGDELPDVAEIDGEGDGVQPYPWPHELGRGLGDGAP
jgi:hypothetical protein